MNKIRGVEKKLNNVVSKIVQNFQPEKIILFGSWAWGTPGPDSDIDLFVIKNTNLPSLKRIEALDRLFSRRETAMDFLVYTPEQVKRRLAIKDFFIEDILAKGKVLYDAATK